MHIHIELTSGMGQQIYELRTSEKFDINYFSGAKSLSFFNLVPDVLQLCHHPNMAHSAKKPHTWWINGRK